MRNELDTGCETTWKTAMCYKLSFIFIMHDGWYILHSLCLSEASQHIGVAVNICYQKRECLSSCQLEFLTH